MKAKKRPKARAKVKPARKRPHKNDRAKVKSNRPRPANKQAKPVKGKRVRIRPPKSLGELIVWRPHYEESWHQTFTPTVVPLRFLPWAVRDYYTGKEVGLVHAMAYPGPKRQIYGRALKPLIYFVVQRADGLKQAWAELPHPSLRGEDRYWQIDGAIKFYQPWKW